MQKPWPALGFGWLLALLVVVIWALVLLHAIAAPVELEAVSFVLLALAVLL